MCVLQYVPVPFLPIQGVLKEKHIQLAPTFFFSQPQNSEIISLGRTFLHKVGAIQAHHGLESISSWIFGPKECCLFTPGCQEYGPATHFPMSLEAIQAPPWQCCCLFGIRFGTQRVIRKEFGYEKCIKMQLVFEWMISSLLAPYILTHHVHIHLFPWILQVHLPFSETNTTT